MGPVELTIDTVGVQLIDAVWSICNKAARGSKIGFDKPRDGHGWRLWVEENDDVTCVAEAVTPEVAFILLSEHRRFRGEPLEPR